MGLIKAAVSAVGSTLHDQWKEYIKCDDLGNDILMKKVTTPNGVITKTSAIQVSPGQIAVVFQSGKILDATAEPGIFTFDESTSPSFFAGDFGAVFKEMWGRFLYNGAVNKEQAVYYINSKDITGNSFETKDSVPFQDWSHVIPNQMTGSMSPLRVGVKCSGNYIFKITDPALFMTKIAGTADVFTKNDIIKQMETEVLDSFQNVLNELGTSEYKVPVLELRSRTDEIKKVLETKEFDAPIKARGMNIVGFVIEKVVLDDESNKKIDNYELSSNAYMQQGTLVGSYSDAVKDAANNPGGAMNGFMGVGMMNMASGGMIGGTAAGVFNNQNLEASRTNYDPYAQNTPSIVAEKAPEAPVQEATTPAAPAQDAPVAAPENAGLAFCPDCGAKKVGKFCTQCGKKLD